MGFNDTQLTLVSHALYRSASPTNELLTKWESSNAKVAHLYHYLAMMKHRRAMYHLLPYVNEQLRDLYSEFEQQQSHLCHTEQHMAQLEQHHRPLESKQAAALRHSTLKDNITPNVFYFDNFGHNKQSDEELTLIDLNNDKRNSFQLDPNRSQAEEEYLMRIEDFKIPYKELVIATDDFAKENILGSGGTKHLLVVILYSNFLLRFRYGFHWRVEGNQSGCQEAQRLGQSVRRGVIWLHLNNLG